MKPQNYSSFVLGLGGILLIGLGLYFVFLRPPLLPEDPRYIGTTLAEIQATLPGLLVWLRRVFWVMGGFMVASGLLTIYIAVTTFGQLGRGTRLLVALANLTSIGWMAVVNFMIDSDFKWLLLTFNFPWILALFLSWVKADRRETAAFV